MAFLQQVQALAQRVLPAPIADQNPVNVRASRYGDLSLMAVTGKKQFLADEGSYYISTNPTPGSAYAGAVSATYDVTKPWANFQNLNSPGGLRAYLDYMKLIPTVIPNAGTTANFAIWRDQISVVVSGTDRTTAVTPVNANGDSNFKSNCLWKIQNSATQGVIAALTPQASLVARGALTSGTGVVATSVGVVVGDEMVIDFGAPDPNAYAGSSAVKVTPNRYGSNCPPLIVAPQQQIFVYLWYANNASTGPSFEFELTHWER